MQITHFENKYIALFKEIENNFILDSIKHVLKTARRTSREEHIPTPFLPLFANFEKMIFSYVDQDVL